MEECLNLLQTLAFVDSVMFTLAGVVLTLMVQAFHSLWLHHNSVMPCRVDAQRQGGTNDN